MFFLILSILFFVATLGIHEIIMTLPVYERPLYTNNPLMSIIPLISGYLLAVIPSTMMFDVNFIILFLANIAFVMLLGNTIAHAYLVRFSSGHPGEDATHTFIAGVVTLVLGLVVIS